jgi:hypothetical protein
MISFGGSDWIYSLAEPLNPQRSSAASEFMSRALHRIRMRSLRQVLNTSAREPTANQEAWSIRIFLETI